VIALYQGVQIERQGLPISINDFSGGRMQDQYSSDYQQALDFFKNKKYKSSFLKLIQVSNYMSKDADYLYLLSEVQNKLADYTARERTLKVLCQVSSNIEYQILYMRALLQNRSVNMSLDIGLSLQSRELSRDQKIELYNLLSEIYIRENDFEGLKELVAAYKEAGILTDQYYFSQSLLSLNDSHQQQALDYLRAAVSTNKNFEQAWVALALLHDKMGDSDLSTANLEKALDLNPLNTSALKHYSAKSISDGFVDKAVEKIDFYLREYNFDHEMTIQYAQLMKLKNKNDVVQRESQKLTYYFGQHISL
jgi:hypothetical protein